MPAVVSLFNGVKGWPSADLAKLLGLVHEELHNRAEHHAKGGGIEAELAKRSKSKRVGGRSEK
jgi:hypothetical protein